MKSKDHPTIRAYQERRINLPEPPAVLESAFLKRMAIEFGVDDVGLIDLSRVSMEQYRQDLLDASPKAQSMMVLVFQVNQNHLRTRTHSLADYEFKQVWTDANHIARRLMLKFAYSGESVHVFRRKASTCSGDNRPGIPEETVRFYRSVATLEFPIFQSPCSLSSLNVGRHPGESRGPEKLTKTGFRPPPE